MTTSFPSPIPQIDVDTASRAALIEHIDKLEWLLADAYPARPDILHLRRALSLTGQQARVVATLMTGKVCTYQHLVSAMATHTPADDLALHNAKVRVCQLRPILRKKRVKIETVWGVGYQIPADDLQRLRSLLSEQVAA